MKKHSRSLRGDALMTALVTALAIALIGAAVPKIMKTLAVQSRQARIMASMATWETKVRAALLSPRSFEAVGTTRIKIRGSSAGDPSGDLSILEGFSVPGVQCAAGTNPCGFVAVLTANAVSKVGSTDTDHSDFKFTGTLRYNGTDLKIKDIVLANLQIPTSTVDLVLGGGTAVPSTPINCPTGDPIFVGFRKRSNGSLDLDPQGRPRPDCLSASAAANLCGNTGHLKEIGFLANKNFNLLCTTPANLAVDCGANRYIRSLSFTAAGVPQVECADRTLDPYSHKKASP